MITLITLLHGWCLEIIFFLVKQLRKKNSSIVYIYKILHAFTSIYTVKNICLCCIGGGVFFRLVVKKIFLFCI